MKPSKRRTIEHRWPLIEKRLDRNDCLKWLERRGYALPPKSACIGCPFHSDAYWRDMKKNRPDEWEDAVEIDRIIRDGVRGTYDLLYLHSQRVPLPRVELSTAEERGQLNLFDNECEGMCGV